MPDRAKRVVETAESKRSLQPSRRVGVLLLNGWQSAVMDTDTIAKVARLIRSRNAIDKQLGAIIGRPPLAGHLGEWVAAEIFGIELEVSASAETIDGRFRSGPLKCKTVNIKSYGKGEGLLDTAVAANPDYYLVLTGPKATTMTSKGGVRPWCIADVYLFDAEQLRADQQARGVKSGIASSVRAKLWAAAEIYPNHVNPALPVTAEQALALDQFTPEP